MMSLTTRQSEANLRSGIDACVRWRLAALDLSVTALSGSTAEAVASGYESSCEYGVNRPFLPVNLPAFATRFDETPNRSAACPRCSQSPGGRAHDPERRVRSGCCSGNRTLQVAMQVLLTA